VTDSLVARSIHSPARVVRKIEEDLGRLVSIWMKIPALGQYQNLRLTES